MGGGGSIVLAAFDPVFTVLPLKVALGCHKFGFWVFQKNNQASDSQVYVHDYFIEMTKNQICPILMQLLMVPLVDGRLDQKLPKTIETPQLKWILGQLGPFS